MTHLAYDLGSVLSRCMYLEIHLWPFRVGISERTCGNEGMWNHPADWRSNASVHVPVGVAGRQSRTMPELEKRLTRALRFSARVTQLRACFGAVLSADGIKHLLVAGFDVCAV